MSDVFRLALLSSNLGHMGADLEAWISAVETRVLDAKSQGVQLLMLPEYVCEGFLAWKPEGLETRDEIAWMAEQAPAAIKALSALVERHGVSVIAGSMPWPVEGGYANRAWILLNDGRALYHDKLSLTPDEQDKDAWNLVPGHELMVFEHEGLTMAVLICLDIEMPALSCLLAPHKPDLVLVPSMTSQLSGYNRVYSCAKARAVELMASVAVCGTVGAAVGTTNNETNVSGAALYVPCEPELGFDGVAGSLPPVDGRSGEEPFLIADAPIGVVRALRGGGAEVWPGAFSADHICVTRAHEVNGSS